MLAKARLPALGYVVDYGQLAVALARALEAEGGCRLVRATVSALEAGPDAAVARFDAGRRPGQATARLLVVADGGALAASRRRAREITARPL